MLLIKSVSFAVAGKLMDCQAAKKKGSSKRYLKDLAVTVRFEEAVLDHMTRSGRAESTKGRSGLYR